MCAPGGTMLDSRPVLASVAYRFEGSLVEIVATGGRRLRLTPHHPVLTARGPVAAGELEAGDSLVVHGSRGDVRCTDHHLAHGGRSAFYRPSRRDLHAGFRGPPPSIEVLVTGRGEDIFGLRDGEPPFQALALRPGFGIAHVSRTREVEFNGPVYAHHALRDLLVLDGIVVGTITKK